MITNEERLDSVNHDQRLQATGAVVSNGVVVEEFVEMLLSGFLPVSRRIRTVFTRRLQISARLAMIKDLSAVIEDQQVRAALLKWVSDVDSVRLARNKIVHSYWELPDEEGHEFRRSARPNGDFHYEEQTLASVNDVVNDLAAVIASFEPLTQALVGTGHWSFGD